MIQLYIHCEKELKMNRYIFGAVIVEAIGIVQGGSWDQKFARFVIGKIISSEPVNFWSQTYLILHLFVGNLTTSIN